MKKDFTKWHSDKSNIQVDKIRPYFGEREIWFTSLGVNIGFEQDGRGERFLRPIVIIKKFNNEVCWGILLTKNEKKGKYYFTFSFSENSTSTAILSQIRLVDAKRLQYKIGDMTEKNFTEIKRKLTQLLV